MSCSNDQSSVVVVVVNLVVVVRSFHPDHSIRAAEVVVIVVTAG